MVQVSDWPLRAGNDANAEYLQFSDQRCPTGYGWRAPQGLTVLAMAYRSLALVCLPSCTPWRLGFVAVSHEPPLSAVKGLVILRPHRFLLCKRATRR